MFIRRHTHIAIRVYGLSAVSSWLYVIDYDLSTKNESRRTYFYEKVHKMLNQHFDKAHVEFSTFSCYTTPDEDLAKKFYDLTKEFCETATMYKAQKIEGFGKREKQ
jgi:hypothetical protein